MKNYILRISLLLLVLFSFTGCEIVEGIFNLGMGVGIFIAIAILAIIVFIIAKVKGK